MKNSRRCVGCREMKDKSALVRIVRQGGEIKVDRTSKAPGRGAYVCPSAECLRSAHKKKGLERSFKRAIPQEIFSELKLICER